MVKFETQVYHKKEKGEDVVGCTVTCMDEKGSVIGEIHVLPVNELNELQERVKALDKKFNDYYNKKDIDTVLEQLKEQFVDKEYLKTELNNYATTKALDVTNSKVEALSENSPLIGQILRRKDTGEWDYESIRGLKDNILFDITGINEAICVVIPPHAYSTESQNTAPLNFVPDRIGVQKKDITKASEEDWIYSGTGTLYSLDLEAHPVKALGGATCLVGVMPFGWEPVKHFNKYIHVTTNWNGKSVTRLLVKPESSSNEEKLIMY